MLEYSLYQSGIHCADIIFKDDCIEHIKKDVFSNKWLEKTILKSKDITKYEEIYKINLKDLNSKLDEFNKIFNIEKFQVETPWGALYQKSEINNNIWCERNKKFPLDIVLVENEVVGFIVTTREVCNVLVKKGYEDYTPLKLWKEKEVSNPQYAVEFKGTFMVPMRDGVKLATDVWLPRNINKKIPTIFVRTPYGKKLFSQAHFKYVQRGYAVVIQDTRGREDSEGKWIPMHFEIEDGDDSINWIVSNDWSDKKVGMIGASYGGYVQWASAASGNKHLKALVSIVTAGGPFIDMPRKGGTLASGMLAWAFAMAEKRFKPENMIRDDWDEILKIRPLKDITKKALNTDVSFWNYWLKHDEYDEFWSKSNWFKHKNKIKVPAMVVSGWFDDNGMGTTEALDIVKEYEKGNKKVFLGPWMHSANTTRDIHGVGFGNNAVRYDLDYYYLAWFDKHLKNIDNGIEKEKEVEYYTLGDNRWREAENWLPKEVKLKNLYLSSSGNANKSDIDGKLIFEKVQAENHDTYVYDPENPAPHLIDLSENEVGVPDNYINVEKRSDVLVYSTDKLKEDITIAGDIHVEFFASSSARDTDWIVRLTDVDEDGNSIKLVDGVLRAKFRNSFDKIELLKPNRIEKYIIRTSKIGNTFRKGHKIRLTITSSADNFIFPNSNTGNDSSTDTEVVKATQKIYHGGKYTSLIKLPVL
ncbi:CocE/NonD family hydrolase [Maledivibacter halophilus]|uniref:Xaa-Pro dipeptidyl-peptidase C-terminal domain-containing protein n=1 Tax=Maledivibacter halophilus TaxID=36842 RepID=A0A1T5LZ21_9FIRM|nr:CocE/NonD family hydrolase [Maledivibacter halophilus]SKC81115.1 hypothetical protein SAMN02194393_03550 [Maledivibacter halophilus]